MKLNYDQIIQLQQWASGWTGIAQRSYELCISLGNHQGYAINAQKMAQTYAAQIRQELGIE